MEIIPLDTIGIIGFKNVKILIRSQTTISFSQQIFEDE